MVDELHEAEKLPPEWMFTDLDTVATAAIRAIRRNKGIAVVRLAIGSPPCASPPAKPLASARSKNAVASERLRGRHRWTTT